MLARRCSRPSFTPATRPHPFPLSRPASLLPHLLLLLQTGSGEPVEGLDYVLYCPDGEKKTGTIPSSGVVREENAKLGVYKLALKGVDPPQLVWDPPAADAASSDPGSAGGSSGAAS